MIAILEDEENRQIAMKEALIEIGEKHCFFDNAPEMISWLEKNLETVKLICLYHFELRKSHAKIRKTKEG